MQGTPTQQLIHRAAVEEWRDQDRRGQYGDQESAVAQRVVDRLGIDFERAKRAAYHCFNEAFARGPRKPDESQL